MEEEFIEQNIEWKEEIRGNNIKYTYIRRKNERKNQILENWKRIREEEESEDRYRRSEDNWRGRKKSERSSDGVRTKKKDNTIRINNRYIVLEDMEEEEEKESRKCEENNKQRSEIYANMAENQWKIILQNVRGLITAESRETLKLIDDYVNNEKIVLINFTETWLDKSIKEEEDIEGFHTYRCDRTSDLLI